MAYKAKYITSYKKLDNSTTTILIKQDGWTGSTTTLIADDNPLTISYDGDSSMIYAGTRGSGAQINVLAEPLTLIELLSNSNPQKNIVQIYSGTTGGTLIWQGYVNTSVYSEDYTNGSGILTPVQINCNDGMQLISNIYFNQNSGSTYGIITIGQVINFILSNLSGITFTNIITSNDLSINGYDVNLFNKLKINAENYTDESLISETCRDTLNDIFKALALTIYFQGATIFIVDPINLNTPSLGRSYTLPDFTESSVAVGGIVDFSGGTISYFETGQSLDIVPQIDELQIKTEPYNYANFNADFADIKNMSCQGTFSNITTCGNNYYKNSSVVYNNWSQSACSGGEKHFLGLKECSTCTPVYAILLNDSGDTVTYTIPHSVLTQDINNVCMKVSMDGYVQTRLNSCCNRCNSENIYGCNFSAPVFQYSVLYSLKVGGQYYHRDTGCWCAAETGQWQHLLTFVDSSVSGAQFAACPACSQVGDKWTTGSDAFTICGLTGGSVTMTIYNCLSFLGSFCACAADSKHTFFCNMEYRRQLLKNLSISFSDSAGKTIDNEGTMLRATSNINTKYKTNVTTITTKNGTSQYGISRATFLTVNNEPLLGFDLYRSGTAHTTEQMLLQSVYSQYKQPRLTFQANLNVKNYGLSIMQKLIKDNKYLNKVFYISKITYDDANLAAQIEAVELATSRESFT
jgi:hypothetical protein